MTPSASPVLCSLCHGENAPDSKFCRHCGHAVDGAVSSASSASADSNGSHSNESHSNGLNSNGSGAGFDLPDDVLPSVAAPDGGEALSSPAEIDARRARHMLERAQGLSERGDSAGAILACRQALALAPMVAGGQAMLGALLERTGDLPHAIQAWEKAAQMAPDSSAPREFARLRDKMGVPSENAPVFHFDDAELFADPTPEAAPVVVAPAGAAPIVAVPATDGIAASDNGTADDGVAAALVSAPVEGEAPAATAPIQAPVSPDAPSNDSAVLVADATPGAISSAAPATDEVVMLQTAATTPIISATATATPSLERRVANVPVRVERRATTGASIPAFRTPAGTPIGARVQTAPHTSVPAPVINPLLLSGSAPKPQGLSAFLAAPSFFTRSLPLVGATVLSLGFLGWARGLADARNLASPPPIVVSSTPIGDSPTTVVAAPSTNSNLPALAPVGSAPANNGGFPISNQPNRGAASGSAGVTTPTSAPVAPAPPAVPATRPAAARRVPPLQIAPAPIPAAGPSRPAGARDNADGSQAPLNLPPPVIPSPLTNPPATSVLPPGPPALNPAGAAGRGYVRITQGRVGSLAPQRSSSRAGDAERSAAAAARSGSTTQAIDGLTAAINANASDAGYRFQQRAMLFMGQGDYSRAIDDFQAAISAYNDQIARGDQVASARAGLSAARSGLNRALAGNR